MWKRPVSILAALLLIAGCGGDDGGGVTQPDPDETGRLQGEVTGPGGPIPEAVVTLTGGGEVTTGADGMFVFDDLDVGEATVTISPPAGFQLAQGEMTSKTATITSGGTASVGWSLRLSDTSPRTLEIGLTATSFSDPDVTIPVGSTVNWVNQTAITHTITPDDPAQPGTWVDETISGEGTEFDHTFGMAGTFDYVCKLHSGMTGVVRVH